MKIEKVKKLVTNLYDKNECAIDIRNLKHALNHGLVLKKVDRVIKFNPRDWLNLYTEMNTEQKQKPKNNFEKDFFKLKENVRNFYKPISLHFCCFTFKNTPSCSFKYFESSDVIVVKKSVRSIFVC